MTDREWEEFLEGWDGTPKAWADGRRIEITVTWSQP